MIAPHEGRELELMLSGEKHLAVFHDVLPDEGNIDEKIIPELAFMPHVAAGTFIRKHQDIISNKSDIIRVVCFATPGNEWRADFIFWQKEKIFSGDTSFYEAYDTVIGSLLGYRNSDIADFIKHQQNHSAAA